MRALLMAVATLFFLSGCGQTAIPFGKVNDVGEWAQAFTTSSAVIEPTDIIFVMDNSSSMKNEVEALRTALAELRTSLAAENRLDYRIYTVSYWDLWTKSVDGKSALTFSNNLSQYSTSENMQPLESFFRDLPFSQFITPVENGIGAAGMALEKLYANTGSEDRATKNVEIILISDEDNDMMSYVHPETGEPMRHYYDRYMRANPTYRYQFRYNSGRTRIGNRNRCVSNTAAPNLNYNYSTHRFHCVAQSGEEIFHMYNPGYGSLTDRYLISVPQRYLCPVTQDGHTEMVSRAYPGEGCTAEDPNQRVSKIATKNSTGFSGYPIVYDSSPLVSCSEQYYIPKVTYTGNPVTDISVESCRTGFTHKLGGNQGYVYKTLAENLARPSGFYYYDNYINRSMTLNEYVSNEEALRRFKEQYPTYQEVTLTHFPDGAETATTALKATPEDFKKLLSESPYQGMKVSFHSVVALKNGACSEGGEENNTKGSKYLELSELTQGFTRDICDTNFNPLMRRLAKTTIFNSLPSRRLPSWANPKAILEIKESSTGRILIEGVDFDITADRYHVKIYSELPGETYEIRLLARRNELNELSE